MFYALIGTAGLLTAAATAMVVTADPQPVTPAAAVRPAAPNHGSDSAAEQRLEQTVRAAIMADGPFFNAEERALVERACGMAPGSWNGTEVNMNDDSFNCANGRNVRSAELDTMMTRAAPRIAARVEAAIGRPEVMAAIDSIAHEATEQALREVHEELGRATRRRD